MAQVTDVLPVHTLRTGAREQGEPVRLVRAGPLTAEIHGPDLRRVRLGHKELVQRVYVGVRDLAWNTIPAELSDVVEEIGEDSFRITFTARHRHENLDFEWRGTVAGSRVGTIEYLMDGTARSGFRYNKIGLNVHHPLHESLGRTYRARSADGELRGVLPAETIEPQLLVDGVLTAMFPPFDELAIDLGEGVEVHFAFAGDMFEMQDHRNWADANLKSYGTPLAVPYPFEAQPGQRLAQSVTISVAGAAEAALRPAGAAGPQVRLGGGSGRGLPRLGLGSASDGIPLTEREVELLRLVRPDHLRVDVHTSDEAHLEALRRGLETAGWLETSVELALYLSEETAPELESVRASLAASRVPLARVLVYFESAGFATGLGTTPPALLALVRETLGEAIRVPLAGGTDVFFADLNRVKPRDAGWDGLVYPVTPTIHAADDVSLMENTTAQGATVLMARSFADGRAVFVSPVTLATRSGPYPAGPPVPGGLPAAVDVRQMSLFGAAWTVGSIADLARGGADSVTYFETVGWRGLMERPAGPAMPDAFPSRPGEVFPVFHVFADIAEWKDGELLEVTADDPYAVAALAVRDAEGTHVLVAELSGQTSRVSVAGLPDGKASVRVLDEDSFHRAAAEPEAWRRETASREVAEGKLELELRPFAVARLDVTPTVADSNRGIQ